MSEQAAPEPDFSLSSRELTLAAVDQMHTAKTTMYAFPGFYDKWQDAMRDQGGQSGRGFLNLTCMTLDGRQARVAYFQSPSLEQVEIRAFRLNTFIPVPRDRSHFERESVFIALSTDNSSPNPTGVLYEHSVDGEPVTTRFENSNVAVERAREALKKMVTAPTVLDEIDQVATSQDMLHTTMDRIRGIIDLPVDIETLGELNEALSKQKPVNRHEPLSDDQLDSFFAEARRDEQQEKMRIDWTPDFLQRWKMLFDGIEE